MTDAHDAIAVLREELADPNRPLDYRDVIVPNEDARAIVAAYDTAVAIRDSIAKSTGCVEACPCWAKLRRKAQRAVNASENKVPQ